MPPARRRPEALKPIERSIHFYRADTGTDTSGSPVPLDVDAALAALDAKPFTPRADGGRYVGSVDGEDLCAWVDASASPQRLRLARLRRNALPQSEMGGQLSAVRLASGAALYEAVHLIFLPDNIIGAEFNFYGPRPTRLPGYLQDAVGALPTPFIMEQILRQDAADQLDRQQGLRMLELRVRRSYAATVAEAAGGLREALTAAAEVGGADIVGLVLQAEPRTRAARLGAGVLASARRLARRPELRENATRFMVRGIDPDGRVEALNLLSDALVSVQKVARAAAASGAVDADSAYSAVETAYHAAREQGLLDGPGVSTVPR